MRLVITQALEKAALLMNNVSFHLSPLGPLSWLVKALNLSFEAQLIEHVIYLGIEFVVLEARSVLLRD